MPLLGARHLASFRRVSPRPGSRDLVGQARLISERRWVRLPRLPLIWLAEPSQTTNGIKVLAAAYVALNHGGEGSSPSDPT